MKAVVYQKYGGPEVLQVKQIAKPVPKSNEVLVKVYATTVTAGDIRMRAFDVPRWQWLFARLYLGVFRPRRGILGMELAGEVEAVGKDVTRYQIGDHVFASTMGSDFGGYAEYKCLSENTLIATMPANLTFEEAAAAPSGGLTAMLILKKANIQPGQTVLIYGASGSVGTFSVQLAKHYGAEVTAVCSTGNVDMVKALGADHVIDYTKTDFTENGQTYDIVFDAVGKLPPNKGKKSVRQGGQYINVNTASVSLKVADFAEVKTLFDAGAMKPVIDRCYSLDEMVDAHRYVQRGHKKGNVAITVQDHLR